MTSLFDGIATIIGSLLRKPGEPVRFHTGGIVSPEALKKFAASRSEPWPCPGLVMIEGNPGFSRGGLVGHPSRKGSEFVVHISAAPQFRKVPITGDMTQMCQDLGIEPMPDYVALRDAMMKRIQDSMGISYKQLIRDNGWTR